MYIENIGGEKVSSPKQIIMDNNGYFKDITRPCTPNMKEDGEEQVEEKDFVLPVKSENRKITDTYFVIVFGIFIIIWLALVSYCMRYSDIYRTINGYDDCGFVCGRENKEIAQEVNATVGKCAEPSKIKFPYLLISKKGNTEDPLKINKSCVEDCRIHLQRKFLNRCVSPNNNTSPKVFLRNLITSKSGVADFFQELTEDLVLCWSEIAYLALMAFVFSILYMTLMRYVTQVMVWVVLVGVVVASIGITIFLWCLWLKQRQVVKEYIVDQAPNLETRKSESYLAFAIIATVVTFIVISVIWVMRKRIELVVELFKEAGKAVAAMPLLFLLPVLTFAVMILFTGCWIYFIITIESAGTMKIIGEGSKGKNTIAKTDGMILARWYNLFAFLWIFQFILGCQHSTIAGAIGTWYFARNKDNVKNPIYKSMYNLCRFHVGSIAFGSFLIATLQFMRVIIKRLEKFLSAYKNPCVTWTIKCCKCCLFIFNGVLKYLNRNAYIEIALYGNTFFEGGKKAYNILTSNALRIATINSVGDSVLLLGKILVVMVTIIVGIEIIQKKEGLLHMWAPLTLSGIFAYLISHCFLTVYEMAIDTVFICFCEDCDLNDGESKPYFMSKDFVKFVDNGKKTQTNKVGVWTISSTENETSNEIQLKKPTKKKLLSYCWGQK